MHSQGLADIASGGHITAEDVTRIRAALYPDMTISANEAEMLFSLNDGAVSTSPEWRALFVEAITDYVVRQAKPEGYVDEAKARWLAERIGRDGRVRTATEFEVLIRVLELATEAPQALKDLALQHAEAFALSPVRSQGRGHAVTADEAARIRRIIYAIAGEGGGWAVSRREAALLFAINDASRGCENDPAWRTLFVQAIGSALLAGSAYDPPSREEALRLETWLESPSEGVGAFLGRWAKAAFDGRAGAGTDPLETSYAERAAALDAAVANASKVTEEEVRWLVAQIGRDRELDENEKALLRFVAEEADSVPPALEPLMAKLSQADDAHS